MAKTINQLFKNITAQIPDSLTGCSVNDAHYDSRKIQTGDLFIAVKGYQADGHNYLNQAAKQGALAAVIETPNPEVNLPQIEVTDSRRAMALIAAELYAEALGEMRLAGITGTNGKTSTAFLLRAILNAAGQPSGLLGTIAYYAGGKATPAWNTTPEALDICRMLNEMHQAGERWAVLEVSSHALALNRVDGLLFDAAVFTNLTRDHMDFHQTDEAYFEAKKHIFNLLKPHAPKVINHDDSWGHGLLQEYAGDCLSFGLDEQAAVQVVDWHGDIQGLELEIKYRDQQFRLHSQLIGAFNVYNIVAAVASALALGIAPEVIQKAVAEFKTVPGRLQAVNATPGVRVVVDYAHTPDALEKALAALRPLTEGRLIALFGAGGNRDKGKRPLMGKAAAANADLVIVTTDNPRFEEPQAIIEDILTGMQADGSHQVIVDRRQAIHQVIAQARPGDVVLIAGKGHEPYQDIKGTKHPFDELAIIREAVQNA